jgi:hypothetical protein
MHTRLLVGDDWLIELVLGANLCCCCEIDPDHHPVVARMVTTRKPEGNESVEGEVQESRCPSVMLKEGKNLKIRATPPERVSMTIEARVLDQFLLVGGNIALKLGRFGARGRVDGAVYEASDRAAVKWPCA